MFPNKLSESFLVLIMLVYTYSEKYNDSMYTQNHNEKILLFFL